MYLTLQHLEEERGLLKDMFNKANNELENLKKPSLLVAEIVSLIDNDKAIIKLPNGNKFYSHISKEVEKLQTEDSVLVDQKSLNVVKKVYLGNNFEVEKFVIVEKPQESWQDLGGLTEEIREIKEVIELPLKRPELFEKVGINPPKGVLLYGPPGTGKTLLAKADANSTKATFIEEGRLEIFKVHTRRMNLQKVKLKELVKDMENFSGAEIRAVCTEAGYFAIRENREYVTQEDFLSAIEKVRMEDEEDGGQFFG